jgi:hypothetical protein
MDGSQFVDLILQGGKKAAKAATKGAAKTKKVKPRITDDEISAILSEGGLTREDLDFAGYPEVAPPTPSVDKKTGKPYLAKTLKSAGRGYDESAQAHPRGHQGGELRALF